MAGLTETTDIVEIGRQPSAWSRKTVRIEGRVVDVCPLSGCWFTLQDRTGRIHVDLQGGRTFTVPRDSAGALAIVEGTVEKGDGPIRIVATGVVLP